MSQKNDYIMTVHEVTSVPVPTQTTTYKPIWHGQLIDLTRQACKDEGLVISNEIYRGAQDGKIVTAYYDINFGVDNEMGLRIAWQNSYNKKVSLKFAIGAHVFVCSNGAFFGDVGSFRKKHVGEVQTVTPEMIRDYVKLAKQVFNNLVLQKGEMKGRKVTNPIISRVLGDLYFHEDLLTETQIAIIKRELKKPTYDYKAPNTAWDLYNHITFALRGIHPSEYIDIHTKIHEYFAKYFDLTQPVTETILNE